MAEGGDADEDQESTDDPVRRLYATLHETQDGDRDEEQEGPGEEGPCPADPAIRRVHAAR